MQVLSQLRDQQQQQLQQQQQHQDRGDACVASSSSSSSSGRCRWVVGLQAALRLPRSVLDLQQQQQQQQLQGSLSVSLAALFRVSEVQQVDPQAARQVLGA